MTTVQFCDIVFSVIWGKPICAKLFREEEMKIMSKKIINVRDLLDDAAERYGDRTFIKYSLNDEVIEKSYMVLNENALAVARYIRCICPDRMHIALVGKTNYEYLTVLTGLLISGNVAVPFAPDISVEEACELFDKADIDILFYENDFEYKANEIAENYSRLKRIVNLGSGETFEKIYQKYNSESEFAELSEVTIDPEACAAIIYTSGTTGIRKGTMLSTSNLISNITYQELEFRDDDVVLSVLPMHHIFCFSGDFLKTIRDGVTVCLNGEISKIGENLQLFQPTIMRVVPMICDTLLRKIRAYERKYPDVTPVEAAQAVLGKRFRWLISAGAYLSPNLVNDYADHGVILRQGYGMTETGPRVSISDFSNHKTDSSGKILSICSVRTVDGEIQVKSPSVMMGYYKMPDETAKMFTDDGWLRTGDLGHIDGGHIYITGRLKNIIILSNGENISPEELEKKFCDDELIKEIVVYAENDRIVAEIYPDYKYAEYNEIDDIQAELNHKIREANRSDTAARQITALKIRSTSFEKTASGKIKRNTVYFS